MRTSKLFPAAALLLGLIPLSAQQQPFTGTPEIEQSLHQLNQLGSVLMIAAHPDDEHTAVLAYFARGRYMRTAYLSLTRGEGGQNLIGSEQGPELGVIRTQELLAARKIDGAEQFFTRAIDFGFTKTASETMEKWGHDRILSDMVWVIRRYRPDVIVLVFSGTPTDGHGQHQVSAILGKEAFSAAADPAKFPEQLKYVTPWQARARGARGFVCYPPRRARRGGFCELAAPTRRRRSGHRRVQPGTGLLLRGAGDHEPQHAPQPGHRRRHAGWAPIRRRSAWWPEPWRPRRRTCSMGSTPPGTGCRAARPSGSILEQAIGEFEPAHPEKVIPLLAKARPLIAAISDPLAKIKLAELDETMARCAGIWVEAQAREAEVAPGATVSVTTTVINRTVATGLARRGAD